MTIAETAEVLAVIKAGIPNAYLKLTDADASAMVMLWAEMFANYDKALVMAAAKTYVWNDKTGRFPAPGALREQIEAIENAICFCSRGYELWEYSGGETKQFPPAVQKFIKDRYREEYEQLYGSSFAPRFANESNKPKLEEGNL